MIARFLAGLQGFLQALANWPGGAVPATFTDTPDSYGYDQTSDDEGAVVAMLATVVCCCAST